jgi:P4 family phage/plasmid primase-like protien
VFVCNNGVLDLDKCIFRNGEPADMMTISSKINFPKDVDSLEAQENILAIQDWLDRIFPEDEVQDYVLNLFSLKLSGNLFKEWIHIFTGSGANGKSQFFKMINKTFGEYFKTFDNTLLNTAKRDANSASPAIASLKGCRIAVTTEPKGGQPFESDKVKELISGDELVGRHLNKDLIRFIPQYAMMMQCNDIPRNESTDDGFWRKMFIIPCPSKFVSKEEDMYKINDPVKFPFHFKAENQECFYTEWAPYLLYLLFERYKVLKRHGYKFNVPDKVKIAVKEYQEEASTYTQFFNDKIVEAPGYKIDSNTLYSEFQIFVGRDFRTQKSLFLKQMERYIGKPKGRNKDYHNFKLFGSSGDLIESDTIANND